LIRMLQALSIPDCQSTLMLVCCGWAGCVLIFEAKCLGN